MLGIGFVLASLILFMVGIAILGSFRSALKRRIDYLQAIRPTPDQIRENPELLENFKREVERANRDFRYIE
ncbi:MAG: hypothetical protein JO135_10125 [Candidatus Eremiobacteraeota bacterium]|nr:hypothetical protein [Candidatus Eremiobacteraeota bacterium]